MKDSTQYLVGVWLLGACVWVTKNPYCWLFVAGQIGCLYLQIKAVKRERQKDDTTG